MDQEVEGDVIVQVPGASYMVWRKDRGEGRRHERGTKSAPATTLTALLAQSRRNELTGDI